LNRLVILLLFAVPAAMAQLISADVAGSVQDQQDLAVTPLVVSR
jgi:hypothetical protein